MTKQYWLKELDSWTLPLKDILISDYIKKLMSFLSIQYATQQTFPHRDYLFLQFRQCNIHSVRVVILTPSMISLSNLPGLSIDGNILTYVNGPLSVVVKNTEKTFYKGLRLEFNPLLSHWANQGVLFLPFSLTYNNTLSESHSRQWKKFILRVIEEIETYNPGVVFLNWGTDFKVSKNSWEFKAEDPVVAFKENREWEFDFIKVNKLLKKLNNIEIQW